MGLKVASYRGDGNKHGNNHIQQVQVLPDDYRIYCLLTEHHFSATGGERNIQKFMKYKSRGTVSKHIRKLLDLGVIECINPSERVKFYKAISGIHVSSVEETNALLYGGNKLGAHPSKPSVVKIRRRSKKTGQFTKSKRKKIPPPTRNYDTVVHKNGKRQKICRQHNISYIGHVTGGPMDKIKWDSVASPNNRFKESGRHDHVPGIGSCYFSWILSKEKNELRIRLPEKYLLPHEIEDKVLDNIGWKAARWFSKRYHIGVGLLRRCSGDYAFEATKQQKEFVEANGTVKIITPTGGVAMLDQSKKPWTEQEFSRIEEARIVADDLAIPGHIELLKREGSDIKQWIATLQDNFSKFMELQHKNQIIHEKQWTEQKSFNQHVSNFMEQQDIKNEMFSMALADGQTKLFGARQIKLDHFIEQEEDKTRMFG